MRGPAKSLYERQYQARHEVKVPILQSMLSGFEKHRVDVVCELLAPGRRLLDVGCGDGSLVLKARHKFDEAYGVDISDAAIAAAKAGAREQGVDDRCFSVADVNETGLPFEDEYFAAVTCVAVLQLLYDPYSALSEFNRVLEKGGTLVIETNNIAYLPRRISLLCGRFPRTSAQLGWDGGTLHYFTMSSLCELLKHGGFKVTEKTGSGVFSKCRSWWPSLLTGNLIVKGAKL